MRFCIKVDKEAKDDIDGKRITSIVNGIILLSGVRS